DTPEAIYRRPQTAFVLEFVGLSVRLSGKVVAATAGKIEVDTALGRLRAGGNFAPGAAVMLAVRPERIKAGVVGENSVTAALRDAVFQGAKIQLHFEANDRDQLMVETADLPSGIPAPGTMLALGWAVADTLVYAAP
ncbi:MAG: TOBE domain-containing protein, partial [Alphaproteobacteria bacterium]|nr:TOBE domain-containing protein [Alphaproteobacteria bacterium]